MLRRRTLASRWAAVATWALALVLLERVLHSASTAVMVLQVVVLVLAALGATKMWLDNSFESHLVVVGAVAATVVGSVLSLTLGMPGGPVMPLTAWHVVALMLSAAISALLVVDARARDVK